MPVTSTPLLFLSETLPSQPSQDGDHRCALPCLACVFLQCAQVCFSHLKGISRSPLSLQPCASEECVTHRWPGGCQLPQGVGSTISSSHADFPARAHSTLPQDGRNSCPPAPHQMVSTSQQSASSRSPREARAHGSWEKPQYLNYPWQSGSTRLQSQHSGHTESQARSF